VQATPYRLEEEKMAVIIQQVVGAAGTRFYPDISGVVRSHNFYPVPPMKTADGIAAVALGLGRTVIGGGKCLMFCPRYPRHLVQFSSPTTCWRIRKPRSGRSIWPTMTGSGKDLKDSSFGLDVAEADGTLHFWGRPIRPTTMPSMTGSAVSGARLVSFAAILKHDYFPLAAILDQLMTIGAEALGRPVEIEFAVRLGETPEFGFLQIRPMALSREAEEIRMDDVAPERLVCQSAKVLGHGRLDEPARRRRRRHAPLRTQQAARKWPARSPI
jgi:hypothetical protein